MKLLESNSYYNTRGRIKSLTESTNTHNFITMFISLITVKFLPSYYTTFKVISEALALLERQQGIQSPIDFFHCRHRTGQL